MIKPKGGTRIMKISAIRSDKVYSKIMNAPLDKKNDIYRYELMKPFEKKWACYSVPMKALTPNGYDVIMASEMLGHIAPTAVDQKQQNNIKLISDNTLWEKCELSIQQSLNCFVEHGVNLPIKEYAFTILLANAKNPYIILNDGYCGDGGIPGYIFSWLLPNEYTLSHLHVALAHETNHNVRFQFIKWKNDITLGEMIVNEGLAENFATFLYGEDKAGPWVTKTDIETLIYGTEFKVYCLERDEEMIQNLVHIEADFWNNHVQAGVIPAPDGSKLADKVIAEYFSDPVDETIELSGYQKQLERRDELKELIDKMTKEVSLIEQEIKMMMGNAEKAKADNYRISWKASQRTDLDRKRIKAEEPEIYDRFKRTSISRRFIVSAA